MQSIRQTVLLEEIELSSATATASASFPERESWRFPSADAESGSSQAAPSTTAPRRDLAVTSPSAAEEWDVKAAAIVIGLTAFFVTFLFGLVTEIVAGLIPLGILSVTCAGSLCLLARGWMLTRLHKQSSTSEEAGS